MKAGRDIQQGSIGPTLRRLAERDLVQHESPYWAATAELTIEDLPAGDRTSGARDQPESISVSGLLGSDPEQYEKWTGGTIGSQAEGGHVETTRGDVAWIEEGASSSSAKDRDQSRGHPILVLSDNRHPRSDRLFIGIPLTTTELAETVALGPEDWTAGRPPADAVAVPWAPRSLPQRSLTATIGTIDHDRVNALCVRTDRYTSPVRQ
jgi:mRNA-degrading endonuclease toxin of MazEF toxin-antitoxin module